MQSCLRHKGTKTTAGPHSYEGDKIGGRSLTPSWINSLLKKDITTFLLTGEGKGKKKHWLLISLK